MACIQQHSHWFILLIIVGPLVILDITTIPPNILIHYYLSIKLAIWTLNWHFIVFFLVYTCSLYFYCFIRLLREEHQSCQYVGKCEAGDLSRAGAQNPCPGLGCSCGSAAQRFLMELGACQAGAADPWEHARLWFGASVSCAPVCWQLGGSSTVLGACEVGGWTEV